MDFHNDDAETPSEDNVSASGVTASQYQEGQYAEVVDSRKVLMFERVDTILQERLETIALAIFST